MSVRAKFRISTVQPGYPAKGGLIKLTPVMPRWDPEKRAYDETDPNKAFWDATPSGEINISINNPDAFEFFGARMGKEFFVDFSEASE